MDSRLRAALEAQLASRRAALDAGAQRVGWKLGVGERERIGAGPVIGHLTSASALPDGAVYREGGRDLVADAEVAVVIGPGGEIAGYGAAVEICDLAAGESPEAIVAANVFHRAFALGSVVVDELPAAGIEGTLVVNGAVRASAPTAPDLAERVSAAGRLLGEIGERLEPGDRVLTGSVVQIRVAAGDEVVAELGPLGRAALRIADL